MPLENKHLEAISASIEQLGITETYDLQERLNPEDLLKTDRGLRNWLKAQQQQGEAALLPLRRVVAYQVALADLKPDADESEVTHLAFAHLFSRTLPKLELTVFEQEAFLRGEFICVMDGVTPIIYELPRTPLFQSVLKRQDIAQAIQALQRTLNDFHQADNDLKHLDAYAQAKTTEAVLKAFNEKLKPHLDDDDITPAIRDFLRSLPHRFSKTGFTGHPACPANVFCAQLAWLITNTHKADALKHFWQALYPELDAEQPLESLPRYGEALLDEPLAKGQKGRLINYRQCYAEKDLRKFAENAQQRIQRFHGPHADYWASTLQPHSALNYRNYWEFFQALLRFLDEHRSKNHPENEEGIPEAAQAVFLPMQQQMLAFKQLATSRSAQGLTFKTLAEASKLLAVIHNLTTPPQGSLNSCFDINHESLQRILHSEGMRELLESIPCNLVSLKASQAQRENMQGSDPLMHHPDYCSALSQCSDEDMAELINQPDSSISIGTIAQTLNLTQDKERGVRRLCNVTATVYDLQKKRAFVQACLGDNLDVSSLLHVNVNDYFLMLKLFRQLGLDQHIPSIFAHFTQDKVLNQLLKCEDNTQIYTLIDVGPAKTKNTYLIALLTNLKNFADIQGHLKHFSHDFPEHADFFQEYPGFQAIHYLSPRAKIQQLIHSFMHHGNVACFTEVFDANDLQKIYPSMVEIVALINTVNISDPDCPKLTLLKTLGAEHIRKHVKPDAIRSFLDRSAQNTQAECSLLSWVREVFFPMPNSLDSLQKILLAAPDSIVKATLAEMPKSWFFDNLRSVDDLKVVCNYVSEKNFQLLFNAANELTNPETQQRWSGEFFINNRARLREIHDLRPDLAALMLYGLDTKWLHDNASSFEALKALLKPVPEVFFKFIFTAPQNAAVFERFIDSPQALLSLYRDHINMGSDMFAKHAHRVCQNADDYLILLKHLPDGRKRSLIQSIDMDFLTRSSTQHQFEILRIFTHAIPDEPANRELDAARQHIKCLSQTILTNKTLKDVGLQLILRCIPAAHQARVFEGADTHAFTGVARSYQDLRDVAKNRYIPFVKKSRMVSHFAFEQFSKATQNEPLTSTDDASNYECYLHPDRIERTQQIFKLLAKEQFFGWLRHRSALHDICDRVYDDRHAKVLVMNAHLRTDSLLREAWRLAGIEQQEEQIKETYLKVFEQKFYSVSKASGSTVFFSSTLKRAKLTVEQPEPGRRLYAVHQALGLK